MEKTREQVLVTCEECGEAYAARKGDESEFILPTNDTECICGNDTFAEVDKGEGMSV